MSGGASALVPTVSWLLACKIEAFLDRGVDDPLTSTDFEDIVSILDGCATLLDEVQSAEQVVRDYIGGWCSSVAADQAMIQSAEGHLPRGGDEAGRLRRLRRTLERLAEMVEPQGELRQSM